MPDILSAVERGLKALRYAIFQASDNLAGMLNGFCAAPYVDHTERFDPDFEAAAAEFPPAAVAGSTPEAAASGGPEEIAPFTERPSGPHPDVVSYEFTIHRTEPISGLLGAMYGFSDDFPDKQFLIIPQDQK